MEAIVFDTRRLEEGELNILGKAAAAAVSTKGPSAGIMASFAYELGELVRTERGARSYVLALDIGAASDAGVKEAFKLFAKMIDGLTKQHCIWGAALAHVIAAVLADELTRRAACRESGTVH